MSLGATASAPASAWEIAVLASSSTVRSLSTSPSADEAAVAVRGVLAEADVGDHGQVRVRLLQRPHRHLHDALVVVGAGADLVLGGGDAEEQDRADPGGGELRRLGYQLGDREALDARASSRPPRGRSRRRRRKAAGSGARARARSREPGRAGRRAAQAAHAWWRGKAFESSLGRSGSPSQDRSARRLALGQGPPLPLRDAAVAFGAWRRGVGRSAYWAIGRPCGASTSRRARRAGRGHRAQRRRQDDAALDPRRDRRARTGARSTAATGRSAGCRSRRRSTGG